MKILVTGHKGYIGSHLYKELNCLGNEVHGIDLKDGENIIDCLPNDNFDYVFHLAALPRVEYSIKNPYYTAKNNVLSTSKLLEWSLKNNVKKFIFSSSSAVTGDDVYPNSPYGLHKLMSEMECRLYSKLYNLDTVCLRYFNVFSEDQEYGGAYSTVICAWMELLKQNKPLRFEGDGTQSRDFVHVKDIISANLFCMEYKNNFNGDFFDVGTGHSITLNQIKDIVQKYYNPEWSFVPERRGDVRHTLANINKLKNIGWCAKINSIDYINKCFKENKHD